MPSAQASRCESKYIHASPLQTRPAVRVLRWNPCRHPRACDVRYENICRLRLTCRDSTEGLIQQDAVGEGSGTVVQHRHDGKCHSIVTGSKDHNTLQRPCSASSQSRVYETAAADLPATTCGVLFPNGYFPIHGLDWFVDKPACRVTLWDSRLRYWRNRWVSGNGHTAKGVVK